MAYQQARHQINTIKRSSSFENPPGWQVDHNVPFTHYALVYLDEGGKLGILNSPSIQEHISTVITDKVHQNFLTAVRKSPGFREPVACSMYTF
jgi:hypothetical protein